MDFPETSKVEGKCLDGIAEDQIAQGGPDHELRKLQLKLSLLLQLPSILSFVLSSYQFAQKGQF